MNRSSRGFLVAAWGMMVILSGCAQRRQEETVPSPSTATDGATPVVQERAVPSQGIPQLLYVKESAIIRADAQGETRASILTLWNPGEASHQIAVHYPERSAMLLVQDFGTAEERGGSMIPKARRVLVLDVRTGSIRTIPLPDAPTPQRPHTWYVLSSDSTRVLRLSSKKMPIENLVSMTWAGDVGVEYFDLKEGVWRAVPMAQTAQHCGRTAIMDPWITDQRWRMAYDGSTALTRAVGADSIESCDVQNEERAPLFSFADLCPEIQRPQYLLPSAYNQNYYLFGCGLQDANMYDVARKHRTNLVRLTGGQDQVVGWYEGGQYLLSPDQRYFLYGHVVEKNLDGIGESMQTFYLYHLADRTREALPSSVFPELFRPFSYDGAYLAYTEENELTPDIDVVVLAGYDIRARKSYPIDTWHEPYGQEPAIIGGQSFLGWMVNANE